MEASVTRTVEDYTFHIRSVAGLESSCYIEDIDVAFDIGCCFDYVAAKPNVLVTHGHADHIAGLVSHAARRTLFRASPARYYVPAHLEADLHVALEAFGRMQQLDIGAVIVPTNAMDEIEINAKWVVKTFPTCHRVPSLGYILYRRQHVLKPAFVGLPSAEIGARKRAGEDVTTTVLSPEIAYTGDTTIEVFLHAVERGYPDLLQVKVLITEATYVDSDRTPADAQARGHIHLDQLIEHVSLFGAVRKILLVHSSARYSPEKLATIVSERSPPQLCDKFVLGR